MSLFRHGESTQTATADFPIYIHDNADDEISHAAFINAYLMSKGVEPADLSDLSPDAHIQAIQSNLPMWGAVLLERILPSPIECDEGRAGVI